MFTTSSGLKFSFYNQTGNLQFNTDINVNTLFGNVNVGISGVSQSGLSGATRLNFLCSSGKIFDPSGRFIGNYSASDVFNISGNINSNYYDIFINNYPVSFKNYKSTGTYNYIYIQPTGVDVEYNIFVKGDLPSVSINNVNCFSGDREGTGYLINNKLPVVIYSGRFTNFTNMPFSLSGLHTGTLFNTGKYYILPNTSGIDSHGLFTGNLELITNGGIITLTTVINISGSPTILPYSFDLNGSNSIYTTQTEIYNSSIQCLSGTGIGMLVSLEYISGTGNFYTSISVLSGYSGLITGSITGSGYLQQYRSGIGTGVGGQLNNNGTGWATGYITGDYLFATGVFVWPYTTPVTGYGTGINYSGLGSGYATFSITGAIMAGSGTYYVNSGKTGNLSTLYSIGATGYIHATGQINYNSPAAFDKLYIYDGNSAIVNSFHYTSLSTLTSYLNSNTGIHRVTAIDDGSNIITLSGLYGTYGNTIGISLDNTNVGTMTVAGAQLYGGQDLGIGRDLITSGNITGFINNIFTGSGNYIGTGQGDLHGTGIVIDYTKTFTGTWNLFTGINTFDMVEYRYNNFYNATKTKYLNNLPIFYTNSTLFSKVEYSNPYDSLLDVVKLTFSGQNTSSGVAIFITGNY